MASSAVYRYFPSRDDLLTALIVDAYDAVGAVAEEVERSGRRGFVERWVLLASAVRSWAVASPQEYALVYGSPVPGYRAPVDTVEPAVRVVAVALRMVSEGLAAGEIDPAPRLPLPRGVKRDLRNVRELAPDVPEEVLARALEAWASLLGSLSLELFGHLENVVFDREAFFLHQARRAATVLASA
jgi:AcrR family transcriptional regulator